MHHSKTCYTEEVRAIRDGGAICRRGNAKAWTLIWVAWLGVVQGALAQAVNTDVASDISAARFDALNSTLNPQTKVASAYAYWEETGTEGAAAKYFKFTATGLINYNSNPASVDAEAIGDWNANPDLTLDFKKKILDQIILQATLDANTNRFLSMTSGNRDELSLQTKISYSDANQFFQGWNHWGVVYLNNKLTGDYNTGFGGPQVKFDDLSLGYTNQYYFTGSITKKATPGNAENIVAFDVSAGRREASPSKKDGNYLQTKFSASHIFNDDWTLSFNPSAKVTYRDSPAQRATLWSNVLVLAYTPHWLTNLSGRSGEIDLLESYSKNFSPIETSNFAQKDAAVSIAVKWPF
jgi:hypothetical protein